MEWFTILAILVSPFLAVYAQSLIEENKEKRNRKIWIFKTLMSTRATPLDVNHVQALNMILLEFSEKNKKEKKVLDSWKVLMDNFGEDTTPPTDPSQQAAYEAKMERWGTANVENLVDLLKVMSETLGYSYDKIQLKKGVYYPKGHGEIEEELKVLRLLLLDLLAGHKSLKVSVQDAD